jgi:hypothetical protein
MHVELRRELRDLCLLAALQQGLRAARTVSIQGYGDTVKAVADAESAILLVLGRRLVIFATCSIIKLLEGLAYATPRPVAWRRALQCTE